MIDTELFSQALSAASAAAYEAVGNPVEGTILSVVRETAEAVDRITEDGHDLLSVGQAGRVAAKQSLDSTPDLLPVLAKAGVVDAGGSGFLLLLDSFLYVIDDHPIPEPEVLVTTVDSLILDSHDDVSNSGTRYEVMYFIEAPDALISDFKKACLRLQGFVCFRRLLVFAVSDCPKCARSEDHGLRCKLSRHLPHQ